MKKRKTEKRHHSDLKILRKTSCARSVPYYCAISIFPSSFFSCYNSLSSESI